MFLCKNKQILNSRFCYIPDPGSLGVLGEETNHLETFIETKKKFILNLQENSLDYISSFFLF